MARPLNPFTTASLTRKFDSMKVALNRNSSLPRTRLTQGGSSKEFAGSIRAANKGVVKATIKNGVK